MDKLKALFKRKKEDKPSSTAGTKTNGTTSAAVPKPADTGKPTTSDPATAPAGAAPVDAPSGAKPAERATTETPAGQTAN